MHSSTVDSATMRAVSVNAGGSRVACCASEPSSPIVDYSKDYHIGEPMLPRLQRRLSATKKCRTCHKIVYFTGIRCKHCGYIAHEACADATPHVCNGEQIRRRQQSAFLFTPEAISAAAACSGSVSAPVSPKSPRSPMSPTEFLRTAFSWMKGTKKSSTSAATSASVPVSPATPAKNTISMIEESKEERSATWSSPERVPPVIVHEQAVANEDSDNAVSEWCIPAKDLQFEKCLRHGREHDIYEGRWHGAVSIYTFKRSQELWSQVNRLMQVRHENCSLFMGACIERNNLAIVTSPRNGPLVAESKGQLSLDEKLSIARQVAQGMGYLHAKGIVHGKLNTTNVVLEKRRAKICLLDQSFPEADKDRQDYGCLPKNTLAFWAPELVKKIHVNGAKVSSRHPSTRATDVYAFGSFLFELFAEQTPFAGESAEAMLYKIGNGLTTDLKNHTEIPRPIRDLIARCWSVVPQERPTFKQVSSFLQENTLACAALNRRHSSSTPNRLDRVGLGLVR